MEQLFEDAKHQWKGIFSPDTTFELTPTHLKTCVSYVQDVKLFNSNLEVVDDAFEYLVNKKQRGDLGQYFTPRYVIDCCVKMLNPQVHESMIDTAAGSCGFPMHTVFHVWNQLNPDMPNMLTTRKRTREETKYVQDKVFAIDIEPKAVRVGRTLNIIAGDGETNVLELNALNYMQWNEITADRAWRTKYHAGFDKLLDFRTNKRGDENYNAFDFDILMANPPFAGDISDDTILHHYAGVSKNAAGKYHSKVGRDILFIERNLNFIKNGGRMAVVLPQGRFNNSSDKHIRDFIAERCRILAVVGLHGNVFKPHTGTKTSVLFVQKWDAELCPKRDDYPIFFATMQEPSKDNSGDKIYRTKPDGSRMKDAHGHFIVKHDLFSQPIDATTHTPAGIAEAFLEFAKREGLSFVGKP